MTDVSTATLFGSKPEMDALTLIDWIRKILAQPHVERNLDAYVELIRQLCKARNAVLVKVATAGAPGQALEILARARVTAPWALEIDAVGPEAPVARARRGGFAHEIVKDRAGKDGLLVLVGVHGRDGMFLALELALFDRPRVNEIVIRCLLVTDLSDRTAGGPAEQADGQLLDMLNLVADVVHHNDFVAASLALVNGLVSRFGLAFAALVRVGDGSAQLTALSHVDRFDRSSEFVQRVESAALNVLRHDRLLTWTDAHLAPPEAPAGNAQDSASASVAALALPAAVSRLMAVPMHDEAGATTFVMLLSVNASAFDSDALDRIQFGLDIVEPRLHDLHDRSRSVVTRLVRRARRVLAQTLGPEHLWPKVAGLTLFVLLLGSLVIPWPYRVDAASELVTDATRVIAAHFDGHIDSVAVTSGDSVEAGAVLATLDTRELIQQRLENVNDLTRFEVEITKAQAAGGLADARINEARADESRARIEQFDHLLSQATSLAPFKGVVVEGERRDLLNAPIRKGEKMFRIAKVENLYLMLYVSERDIREVRVGAGGDVMLLSRPDQQIGFHVVSINPVGQVKGQEGNQFQIKAVVSSSAQAWWRPGMTGVAKLEAGPRQIFWILTHRFVDFVRLKLLF